MGSMPHISYQNRRDTRRIAVAGATSFARGLGSYAARRLTRRSNKGTMSLKGQYRRSKRTYTTPSKSKLYQGVSKRNVLDQTTGHTLNEVHLCELSRIARGVDLNQRERDQIIMAGVRIRVELTNNEATPDTDSLPYHFCWAVIQFKQRTPGTAVTNADVKTDMFKGAASSRNIDYGVTAPIHKMFYALNTDKYEVLARGDIPHVATSSEHSGMLMNHVMIDKYVKINKSVEYDGSTDVTANNPILFIYWIVRVDSTGNDPGADQHKGRVSTLSYFRDVV